MIISNRALQQLWLLVAGLVGAGACAGFALVLGGWASAIYAVLALSFTFLAGCLWATIPLEEAVFWANAAIPPDSAVENPVAARRATRRRA